MALHGHSNGKRWHSDSNLPFDAILFIVRGRESEISFFTFNFSGIPNVKFIGLIDEPYGLQSITYDLRATTYHKVTR